MAPYTVRHVVSGDHDALRALRLRSLREDPAAFGATLDRDAAKPATWWTDWAGASDRGDIQRTFVLVEPGGAWSGLALVRRLDDAVAAKAADAELNAMWIAADARGSGGAKLLCDACANWAAALGLGRVRLVVREQNARAIAAYASAGFRVDDDARAADERHDSLVMTRDLRLLLGAAELWRQLRLARRDGLLRRRVVRVDLAELRGGVVRGRIGHVQPVLA